MKLRQFLSKSLVLGGNAFDSGLVTPGSIPGTGGFDTFCRNYVYIYIFCFDNSKKCVYRFYWKCHTGN